MKTKSLEPYLDEHPFFNGTDPAYIKLLSGCAKNVRFNPDEMIFKQDQPAEFFYLIRHGLVSVEIPAPGKHPIIIQTLHPGDVLGWSWLFPPYRWNFDARALEPTRAVALDGVCLRGKCDADHSLGYDLMKRFSKVVTEHMMATEFQLIDLYGPHE